MEEDLVLRYRTKEVNRVDCWLYQAVIVCLYCLVHAWQVVGTQVGTHIISMC